LAEVRLGDGESLESALRRFKRKVQQEDIIREVKRHAFFVPPGEKRRLKCPRTQTQSQEIPTTDRVETRSFGNFRSYPKTRFAISVADRFLFFTPPSDSAAPRFSPILLRAGDTPDNSTLTHFVSNLLQTPQLRCLQLSLASLARALLS